MGGIQELATTTAGPHQGHELGLGSPNDPCVCGPALVVTINSFRNELNMIHKQLISACALMLLVLAGCDSGVVNVRALPTPEPEQPPANLPVQLHQRNWTGSLGQGSCVHASLVNHLRWLNRFELGERWRTTYADGEWDSRLRDRLDAAGIDYSYTLKADPRFWIGPVQPGEERSSGGSRRIAARSSVGSSVMGSNTQRSSTTTIRGDSNSRLVNSSSAYGQATEALP